MEAAAATPTSESQARTNPPSAAQLIAGVQEAWARFLHAESVRRRGGVGRRAYVYASAYRECERRMVLEMVAPDALPPLPPDVLANLRRGEDRERNLKADLIQIGRNADPPFEFIGEQHRFELKDRKGRVAIVGKVDGFIQFQNRVKVPTEIKSWNANMVARIRTFDDLLLSPWTKSGAHQILSYLFGSNQPGGYLLLDRHGLPHIIPVEMTDENLERMETFLTRAESAIDHAEIIVEAYKAELQFELDELLPPFIDDAAECRRCAFFGTMCNPPIKSEGATVIVDEETLAELERWYQTRDAGREFAKLDKDLKERFHGVKMAIGGPFLVQGKWRRGVKTELSSEAKAQVDAIVAPFKKSTDKGSFITEIVRTDVPARPDADASEA